MKVPTGAGAGVEVAEMFCGGGNGRGDWLTGMGAEHATLADQPAGPKLHADAGAKHPSGSASFPGIGLPAHDVAPLAHLESHRVDEEQLSRRVSTSEPPISSGLH